MINRITFPVAFKYPVTNKGLIDGSDMQFKREQKFVCKQDLGF